MGFLYKYGSYPKNHSSSVKVRCAAERLYTRLRELTMEGLEISDYNRRYFGSHVGHADVLRGHLAKYGYILEWALSGIDKNPENIVLLDYGGGHGMLSLLAKEVGVGTVIHNDIYPISCQDAEKIASAIGLRADHYVPGDIDGVCEYCKIHGISCDVVANYDVIEHIYDIDDFLGKLNTLSDGPMSVFLASAANNLNPRIRRLLQKQHHEFEYQDRPLKYGRKPTDAIRAILDIRKEIVSSRSPSLPVEKVEHLAVLTRGLMEREIVAAVDTYLATGKFPEPPKHPTNTCDPYTGNWFERLMDPHQLAASLSRRGFVTEVRCGYYDSSSNLLSRSLKAALNAAITVLGRHGLRLAPYFALYARR